MSRLLPTVGERGRDDAGFGRHRSWPRARAHVPAIRGVGRARHRVRYLDTRADRYARSLLADKGGQPNPGPTRVRSLPPAQLPSARGRAGRKGEELELRIDSLAYGGNGVGRVDGFVVFVRGGLPGDLVRARRRR